MARKTREQLATQIISTIKTSVLADPTKTRGVDHRQLERDIVDSAIFPVDLAGSMIAVDFADYVGDNGTSLVPAWYQITDATPAPCVVQVRGAQISPWAWRASDGAPGRYDMGSGVFTPASAADPGGVPYFVATDARLLSAGVGSVLRRHNAGGRVRFFENLVVFTASPVPAPTGAPSDTNWSEVSAGDVLGYTPENAANKGAANGYAALNGSGQVPAGQLPSYVDDVLEFANAAAFPVTGETGKIYLATNVNWQYRWTGSTYSKLSDSGLTSDQYDALYGANAPTGGNPFATKADIIVAPFVVRSADGLMATGYATFVAARVAALASERIECYTDCTLPIGVVNEVWMPGYVLTLPDSVDISANITAQRISQPSGLGPFFQANTIRITGYLELTSNADLQSATNLTLIGGGVVGLNCKSGAVVILQDGHFTPLPGGVFQNDPITAYLKNASTSGSLGPDVAIIDLDNRLRSAPVVVDLTNPAYYSLATLTLTLTALPFAECIHLSAAAAIATIIGYNMPHTLRITSPAFADVEVSITQAHVTVNDVVGWGQVQGTVIVTSNVTIKSLSGFIELRRKYDAVGANWYWLVVNSNYGI